MSPTREIVAPAAAKGQPASVLVRGGDFLFLSGLTATDPKTGERLPGTTAGETRQILTNLKELLEAAGSSLDKVVKCNVYCTDAKHFATINAVYARYFPKDPPARSFICVSAWHGPFDVEMDCIATI